MRDCMTDRKRRRWFDDDFFFPFEQIREELDRIADQMMRGEDEFFKELRKPPVSKVYGVSIHIGPDGKPVVEEFGHIKPREKKISEEREPLVDVMVEGNNVVVIAEVPGVADEDIKLSGDADTLEIKVETAQRRYYKKLKLPANVEHKKAKMSYKNGILEVRLPIKSH